MPFCISHMVASCSFFLASARPSTKGLIGPSAPFSATNASMSENQLMMARPPWAGSFLPTRSSAWMPLVPS